MKKVIATIPSILVFCLIFMGCESMQVASEADYGKLNNVVVSKFKKDALFSKILVWGVTKQESAKDISNTEMRAFFTMTTNNVAESYSPPDKIIEFNDKNTGVLIIKNACVYNDGNPLYFYYLYYRLTIIVKDFKYKISLEPLNFEFTAYKQTGNLNRDMAKVIKKEFQRLNKSLFDYIENNNINKINTDF